MKIAGVEEKSRDLFSDLELVDKIDREIEEQLPLYYNQFLMGGYFHMPSARMAPSGTVAMGVGKFTASALYGVNLQVFNRLELSANYRNRNLTQNNRERIGNIKFALLRPQDGLEHFPSLAIGMDDFLGAGRYDSPYLVTTEQFLRGNVELSIGYGWKNMHGVFGGVAWTPLRKQELFFLKDLSFLAEYDAVDRRMNWGVAFLGGEWLQASLNTAGGNTISGSLSVRYPLGTTRGFLPKVDDPKIYRTPVDIEPLGPLRGEKELAQELAYGLSDQGLDLYTLFLTYNAQKEKVLWMKIVNNRYRDESDVRKRIENFLASILPSDIKEAIIVMEADGLPVFSYRFQRDDLYRYRMRLMDEFELHTLSPMIEAEPAPNRYERALLFQRKKEIWTFTARPRILTFFGSATGNFQYDIAAIAVPEGYLFDQIYYRVQAAYSFAASDFPQNCTPANPSQLPNVRTDTLAYYQRYQFALEEGFLQKGWNLERGWFGRVALGYFERAYGGVAAELLYYPVGSSWAVGLQGAGLLKRRYQGIGFTHKIRKFQGNCLRHVPFIGSQYFLDFYYALDPLKVDFKLSLGQFLAKDLGARIEVGKTFSSGLRFSVWGTFTNGHDIVNCTTYYDKGFCFCIPLDFFLKQSSRTYIGNSISAWLRDVGARAATGKPLLTTVSEERESAGMCDCYP